MPGKKKNQKVSEGAGAGGGKGSKNSTEKLHKKPPAKRRKRKIGPDLHEKAKFGKPPYIQEWDAFEGEAKRLFQRNPNNVRMCECLQ